MDASGRTLTVPIHGGSFPAVVLVHGSGPQDRDESIGPNKPFRDIAWGLASKGIVVLRYEKRTRQYTARFTKIIDNFTVQEETIADALEAVSLLKKNGAVRADRIFVLGHSLGGMLIPRIGKSGSAVAGFIMMAANARPFEDLILEQALFQASLTTGLTVEAKRNIFEVKNQVAAIKDLAGKGASNTTFLGAPKRYWMDFQGYIPTAAAREIEQPMLIMQGEKDCQVSSEKDFEWPTFSILDWISSYRSSGPTGPHRPGQRRRRGKSRRPQIDTGSLPQNYPQCCNIGDIATKNLTKHHFLHISTKFSEAL